MPRVSQLFFKTAVVFLIIGIGLGLHMGLAGDHSAFPAHAHINLLGWVTSALFAVYYAFNPAKAERRLAMTHYAVYTVGLVIMLPSLYLKYGAGMDAIEPVLGIGALVVALGVLIFAVTVFSGESVRPTVPAATAGAR